VGKKGFILALVKVKCNLIGSDHPPAQGFVGWGSEVRANRPTVEETDRYGNRSVDENKQQAGQPPAEFI
jgi:hypothetical protein